MKIKKCRICSYKQFTDILSFKDVALSGSFLKKIKLKYEKKYPLTLVICNNCKHIQINQVVKPDILFKKYLWETSISSHNQKLIINLSKVIYKYKKNNIKIFEIASNDGTCLKILEEKLNAKVMGIDPAINIAKVANLNNVNTLNKYFNYKESDKIKKNMVNLMYA